MNKLQIHTRVRRLFHYLEDFEKGIIRIPAFQRDFIWDNKKKIELFDSIKKGYPIGSILFWRPEENSIHNSDKFEAKNIGSYELKDRVNDYFYILDGFQRLSTLYGCLINPSKTSLKRNDQEWHKEFNIIYNLENDQFEHSTKNNVNDLEVFKIPLYKLVDGKEFFEFQRRLIIQNISDEKVEDYLKKYENLSSIIIDYSIPSIDMIGGSIDEAIDIFSRVNSTGAAISEDWKLSAKTYTSDFRLGTLINDTLITLKHFNFYSKKSNNSALRELIFRCIQSSFGDLYLDTKKTDVRALTEKANFAETVKKTSSSAIKAAEFLYQELLVVEYQLLPANLQFIFLVEFFNHIDSPSDKQI